MSITLSIESSAKAASVALTDGKTLIAQYFQNSGLTHSRTLLALARDILRNNELTITDVAKIAVAQGPGSFTGIRIGIAAAQGLSFGADIPVAGVSTLLAAASVFQDADVVLCPLMDARRGEAYNALFRYADGKTVRLCADRAVPVRDIAVEARESGAPYLLFGDGAELFAEVFAEVGANAWLAPEMTRLQCAYGVALAALDADYTREVEPNYLRVPQAERERLAKNALDNPLQP